MTRKRRVFTAEFKRDAVDLWKNSDRTARQVEVELGLSTGILHKWQQQLKRDGAEAFPGKGKLKASDEYVRQLERELAIVKQERDILKRNERMRAFEASSVHQTGAVCVDRARAVFDKIKRVHPSFV